MGKYQGDGEVSGWEMYQGREGTYQGVTWGSIRVGGCIRVGRGRIRG